MPADATHESPEGNDFFLGDDILEVPGGTVQGHLLDGLGRLAGVLRTKNTQSFR